MTNWFLETIGASDEIAVNLKDVNLVWQRPYLLWLLLLLVPVGIYMYLRQRANLVSVPRQLCGWLTGLRLAVLALMIAVLAGPLLRLDREIEKRPLVALLFDQSQSMKLPAGPFVVEEEALAIAQAAGYPTPDGQIDPEVRRANNQIGRAELAQTVVENSRESFLAPLAEKYDLRFYSFSREVVAFPLNPSQPKFPDTLTAEGPSTYLGDAVARVLDEAAGRPIAGVVVFTDGVNTGGRSPGDVAAEAKRLRAPVYTVPVGVGTRKNDVAIIDVFTSGQVSVGDTARVSLTLESWGFEGRPVTVELKEGEVVLNSKELVLHNEQQQLELTFEAKTPGPKYLTVGLPPQPEEPAELHSNNTDAAFVRVSDEKIRVLFLDGTPRWDFRFLKNAMRRDHGLGGRAATATATPTPGAPDLTQPDIFVETELRRRPEGASAALPATLDALAEYHTVIVGDVSPELLHGEFLELFGQAVRERGVGLVIAAGPQHMPHRFDDRLRDLLPVRLAPKAAGLTAEAYNPFTLELTPEGEIHESMRLYDDTGRNQNVWSGMPPYFWSAAVQRAGPAATVLAVNPARTNSYGKLPLIAWHYAGDGKVLFLGTDSTWLWRQNVGDRFFYSFWGQTIRFVARRDDAHLKKSWVEVRPLRAQPGEEARIELMAFDAEGAPREERTLPVTIAGDGTVQTVELIADQQTKGRYTGAFTPKQAGSFKITFSPGGGADLAEAQFRVLVAPEELRHPHVDREVLQQLAVGSRVNEEAVPAQPKPSENAAPAPAKGRLVELPDLASIPPELTGETKTFRPPPQEASLWDNWLTLVLLLFLYSLDVGLRRLAGLS